MTILLIALCVVLTIIFFKDEQKRTELYNKIYLLGVRNEIIDKYREKYKTHLPDNFINNLDKLSPLAIIEFKHLFLNDKMDKDKLVKDLLDCTFEETLADSVKIGNYYTIIQHYKLQNK